MFWFFFLPFSQKGNLSHSPPQKKNLIWGHVLISFSFFVALLVVIVVIVVVVAFVFVLVGLAFQCIIIILVVISSASLLFFFWLLVSLIFYCWLVLVSALGFLLCWFSWMFIFTNLCLLFLLLFFFLLAFLVDLSCCRSLFLFSTFLLWPFFLPDGLSFCFACHCLVWSCACFFWFCVFCFILLLFGFFYLCWFWLFVSLSLNGMRWSLKRLHLSHFLKHQTL